MQKRVTPPTETPWLTRAEAASYLRLSISSLENYARSGLDGPPFFKSPSGRCLYRRDLLDEFMGAALRSTTEARSRRARQDAAA
jgi:hypothetical protein